MFPAWDPGGTVRVHSIANSGQRQIVFCANSSLGLLPLRGRLQACGGSCGYRVCGAGAGASRNGLTIFVHSA
jgi:hypothetical protein